MMMFSTGLLSGGRGTSARHPVAHASAVGVLGLLAASSGHAGAAETAITDATARSSVGFNSSRSVEGELAETAERQREGSLESFGDRKKDLEARTGFTYGFDNFTQYLGADSDRSPSDAASNVTRFYGNWTVKGRGTPDNGAVVFKIENRTAISDKLSTQALGPSLGYAGVFASTYSDAGLVLTNLYWRQRFAGGRGSFVIGQVDVFDYTSVNSLASPWTAFTNLAFEQQPTFAGPSQGLGTAMLWRLNDKWAVLGGVANANGDPSDPLDSAQELFDSGETFKHFAIGWSPAWADRADESVQLTFWQIDKRKEAGVDGGNGVSLVASTRVGTWRPFLRAGYADGAGRSLDRAISVGTGYDARGGKDQAGVAGGWGRAPDSSRDQFTLEAFYRYDITDFLQLTPEIQYVLNPSNDPETDDILVLGVRLRLFF
jgi:porin